MQIQKWLIIMGCLLIIIGILWHWISEWNIGKLPGDILIKKGHMTFYFPIITCLIISILISLIIWLLNR